MVAVLFLCFLAAARLVIPNRTVIPYLFPISAFGLLMATLFSSGAGLILSIVISVLVCSSLKAAF